MKVWVRTPKVAGDTARFRWDASAPNAHQDADTFFLHYEGVDLDRFAVELFYEVFLALQLRVFAAYSERVAIHFPTPVSSWTADFWRAYHGARHVTITPLSEGGYDPWRAPPRPTADSRPMAVFFGGGKDSMVTTCLLADGRGRDQVLLIQYVGPLLDRPRDWAAVERRQETLMLRPARERLGVATTRVWTDYQARFRPESYRYRPHLELYTAGSLPTLLAHGVSMCTFCLDRASYSARRDAIGRLVYHYAKSRPEMLADQSRHYQRALGVDLTVANLNFPLNGLMAIKLLADRFPTALSHIVMCPAAGGTRRWCHRCVKCALFCLFSLAVGTIALDFDYERFLTRSPFARGLHAYAEGGADLTMLGNAPWRPFLCLPRNYLLVCHVLATLDLAALPIRLSAAAFGNLALAMGRFGNTIFPDQGAVWQTSLDLLGAPWGATVLDLTGRSFPIVDRPTGPQLAGNRPIEYDFTQSMPTPTAHLPHLRREPTEPVAVAANVTRA